MSTLYRGRRAALLENDHLRVTVLQEGGHIAALTHKESGVNPLWTPPWPSMEPSTYSLAAHPEYGADAESKLLAGIMGHNLCVDQFGAPSADEAKAGLTVHGEGSVVAYEIEPGPHTLTLRATLPLAQLRFTRHLELAADQPLLLFHETVENLGAHDRPIAWTQHVTLGPPFLERGRTQFRLPGTRSQVIAGDNPHSAMQPGAEFDWPQVPLKQGGTADLRVYTAAPVSAAYTAHLLDPHREQAFLLAYSPSSCVLCGYVWARADFPWMGIWEENHSRTTPPWNGQTMTRGMEFGASPFPEPRRRMIERGSLFGVPGYRWLPGRGKLEVRYCAFVQTAAAIPDEAAWDGARKISFIQH